MKAYICLLLLVSSSFAYDADFISSDYQSQTRQQKLTKLWGSIAADQNSGSYPSALSLGGIFLEDMGFTLWNEGDYMENNRVKYIHSVGNTAQVKFIAENNSPFTGLFRGADSGLIRLSCAKQLDSTKTTAAQAFDNFTPGFGLKLLRNNIKSGNLVAMYGVNGIPSWNFFDKNYPFSNHISGAKGLALKAVAAKFGTATNIVTQVGLSDIAAYDQYGNAESNPVTPYKLVFRPTDEVNQLFSTNYTQYFTDQLKTIKAGTNIYDVYAVRNPSYTCEFKIGTLQLKSQLITSKFGDEKLFFQHQDMNDDIKTHSQWKEYAPYYDAIFNADATPKKQEVSCPYKNLFE